MKWFVGCLFLILSTQFSFGFYTVRVSCHLEPHSLSNAHWTTHQKGFQGRKCWHSTTTIPVKMTSHSSLFEQFKEWKERKFLACAYGWADCDPIVKEFMELSPGSSTN